MPNPPVLVNGLAKASGEVLATIGFVLLLLFLARNWLRQLVGLFRNSFTQRDRNPWRALVPGKPLIAAGDETLDQIPAGVSLRSRPPLTPGEAAFYRALVPAVGSRYSILTQVPLCVLVDVYAGNQRVWQSFYNRIDRKRVDFVLVDPTRLCVEAVIELIDRSHQQDDRIARDKLVAEVLREAGLKLIRVAAQMSYDPVTVRGLLGLSRSGDQTGGGELGPSEKTRPK